MSTGPVTVAPFRGDVIFSVTFLAACACAAGGSNAAAHNASTTAGIDVFTLVTSCLQSLPLDASQVARYTELPWRRLANDTPFNTRTIAPKTISKTPGTRESWGSGRGGATLAG
jgi:hypothetical protein